jgi:hypothetical protein
MIRLRPSRRRHGYTLTVVLITLMLLFALWSFVSRTTSSLLRIETSRLLTQMDNQGATNALAQALQLLQYSTPSDPDNPKSTEFIYYVAMNIPDTNLVNYKVSTLYYKVVFTYLSGSNPPRGSNLPRWQVQVSQVPQESYDPTKVLPGSAPPAWPAGAGQ